MNLMFVDQQKRNTECIGFEENKGGQIYNTPVNSHGECRRRTRDLQDLYFSSSNFQEYVRNMQWSEYLIPEHFNSQKNGGEERFNRLALRLFYGQPFEEEVAWLRRLLALIGEKIYNQPRPTVFNSTESIATYFVSYGPARNLLNSLMNIEKADEYSSDAMRVDVYKQCVQFYISNIFSTIFLRFPFNVARSIDQKFEWFPFATGAALNRDMNPLLNIAAALYEGFRDENIKKLMILSLANIHFSPDELAKRIKNYRFEIEFMRGLVEKQDKFLDQSGDVKFAENRFFDRLEYFFNEEVKSRACLRVEVANELKKRNEILEKSIKRGNVLKEKREKQLQENLAILKEKEATLTYYMEDSGVKGEKIQDLDETIERLEGEIVELYEKNMILNNEISILGNDIEGCQQNLMSNKMNEVNLIENIVDQKIINTINIGDFSHRNLQGRSPWINLFHEQGLL